MALMGQVRKAVILAAGLGTRLLPATKAVPKEMLAIIDKPVIQYAVEEVVAAGIDQIIFVVAHGKEAIAEHFGHQSRVEAALRGRGDESLLPVVREPAQLAHYQYVLQDRPLGIGHAVACAQELVGHEPFALLFPDDLIVGEEPCLAQMTAAWERCGGSLLAVEPVAEADLSRYGVVDPAGDGNPMPLRGLVEKPAPGAAPSNLGVVGRYILAPSIFDHIAQTRPGAGGEVQISDALAAQMAAGEPLWAFRYRGQRFDTGRPAGMIRATLALGWDRPDIRPALAKWLDCMTGRRTV